MLTLKIEDRLQIAIEELTKNKTIIMLLTV